MNLKKYLIVLLLSIGSVIMISCESSVPLNEEQLVYAGVWEAPGDIMIKISADGGGDFKLSNTSVSGGNTTFTADGFVIGLFGIENTFVIEKEPFEEEGKTYMLVSGIKYRKAEY